MQFSKKEQWIVFASVNGILLLGIILFPLYCEYVPRIPFSDCSLLTYLHIYCPACGGTRALRALLHLDIVGSLLYNPMVIVGFLWLVAYEVGMVKNLIKKGSRQLLLKPWMIYVTLGIWAFYSILRNVLLIWGIDLTGDIIPPM